MAKVLVFGLGGVGIIYGLLLEQGGAQVTAVCRSNYQQVHDNGITLRSAKWGTRQAYPTAAHSVEEAAQHGPFDYALVCSKAFPGTAKLIRAAVSSNTAIVLAQNGIGIEDEYAKAYPDNTIISGAVYLPTTQVSPGVAEHGNPLERFEIGTCPATASSAAKSQATRFAEIFQKGGGTCVVYDDVQGQRWSKLALNAALNPTTALALCDDGNFIRSSPGALDMMRIVMREVGSVAKAYGYDVVSEEGIEVALARHAERMHTGGKEPSMLVDIRENRAVEVDAILGNVVKMAEANGVSVPSLNMLHVLTKARNFAIVQGDEWKPVARV